jgi:hypothetical protein
MVILASLIWGAPGWYWPAVIIAAVMAALLAWGYSLAPASPAVRICAGLLKAAGIAA